MGETVSFKYGTTKSSSLQKTEQWSAEVTTKVSENFFVEGVSVSASIRAEQSSQYRNDWSMNQEETFTITLPSSDEGKALWQWQLTVKDLCGVTIPKTLDYALTAGAGTPPKCFPGYGKGDSVDYQQCTDQAHTLPYYRSSLEDFTDANVVNESSISIV